MNATINALPDIGLGILALIALVIAGLVWLARRDRRRAAVAVEWGTPLVEIIEADRRDPLDAANPVDTIDLSDALIFAELTALHPVRLDWAPPSFTQEWHAIGQQMRELGETQRIEKVAA